MNNNRGLLIAAVVGGGTLMLACLIIAVAGAILFIASEDVTEARSASPYPEALVDADGAVGFAVGDPDAPITIVEYGDFSCPYCAAFAADTDSYLTEQMAAGEVRFVYKPLTFVNPPTSTDAADASYCAAQQDAFWPMYKQLWVIFEAEGADGYSDADLVIDAAEQIEGMDTEAFAACYRVGIPQDLLDAVAEEADERGVRGTPTVFVNGNRVTFTGNGYVDSLREAVEEAFGPDV